MNFQHFLIVLAILLATIWMARGAYESFQSPGTIVQLLAKGPQDWYLTGWPYGYYDDWDPYYYGNPSTFSF